MESHGKRSSDKPLLIIEKFCKNNSISTTNILAITVNCNYSSEFSPLIVDWENYEVIPNYPTQFLKDYKELKVGNLMICYIENLSKEFF
jgi:hypothetical protein